MSGLNRTPRRTHLAALGLVVVLGLAFTQPTVGPPITRQEPPRTVEQEVEAFLQSYLAALETRDEKALLGMFAVDDRFRWFTDGALSYSSSSEVLAGMQRFAGIEFKTNLTDIRVLPLAPTHASASASFQTELTIPGADNHTYGGVITWLLERKAPSDPWRIPQGHTSTPGAPPARGKDDERSGDGG